MRTRLSTFRNVSRLEETMMRSVMPLTSKRDPNPMPVFGADGRLSVPRTVKVPNLTITIGESVKSLSIN